LRLRANGSSESIFCRIRRLVKALVSDRAWNCRDLRPKYQNSCYQRSRDRRQLWSDEPKRQEMMHFATVHTLTLLERSEICQSKRVQGPVRSGIPYSCQTGYNLDSSVLVGVSVSLYRASTGRQLSSQSSR
jgi:hypothetical protein